MTHMTHITHMGSTELSLSEREGIERAIERLNANYWFEVDRNEGRRAHEMFVEDGCYTTSMKQRSGRTAIADFYRGRQTPGPRTARHVATNMRVDVVDRDHASADWILLLYAADGLPVLASEPAIMIADVRDECVRGADGVWRYRSRTIVPVFKSATPTTG